MFNMYILPMDARDFPYPVYRFSNRTAEECASFYAHLRRCTIIITFADVVPDFTEFAPDGIYTIIPLEGNNDTR